MKAMIQGQEGELGLFCYCKVLTLPEKWYMLFENEPGSDVKVHLPLFTVAI